MAEMPERSVYLIFKNKARGLFFPAAPPFVLVASFHLLPLCSLFPPLPLEIFEMWPFTVWLLDFWALG